MKRTGVLFAILFLATLAAAAPTPAAAAANTSLLHKGSHGEPVAGLQWMLGGHKPSVYRVVTFKHKPNGLFGRRTARAVVAMKTRLGFPKRALTPVAGRDLIEILKGQRARPPAYKARARARARAVVTAPAWAQRLIAIERSQRGVTESWGTNWGPQVRLYQIVTGALHAPWCASFQQWARVKAGLGTIANRSAGVFYIVDWSRRHGLSRTRPRPGYLVGFLDRLGHIGLVQKVTPGGYWTIEGNASDSVLERFHQFPSNRPVEFLAAGPNA